MSFWDNLRDPAYANPAFAALADATMNPYANPILEFALAGRQGLERHQQLEAERLKREAEEERRRQADEEREKARALQLATMYQDPAARQQIDALYPEYAAMLGPIGGEADRRAGGAEVAAAAAERAEGEALVARMGQYAELAKELPPQIQDMAAGMLEVGDHTGFMNLIESAAKQTMKPKTTREQGRRELRALGGGRQGMIDPVTGDVQVIYEPEVDEDAAKQKQYEKTLDRFIKLSAAAEYNPESPYYNKTLEELERMAAEKVGLGAGGDSGGDLLAEVEEGLLAEVVRSAAQVGVTLSREKIARNAAANGRSYEEELEALAMELGVMR